MMFQFLSQITAGNKVNERLEKLTIFVRFEFFFCAARNQ